MPNAAPDAGSQRNGSAEASYYTWSISSTPLAWGATPIILEPSEALFALKDGKGVVLRVPLPVRLFHQWLDGRIDDPAAAGKGRPGPREHPRAVSHGRGQGATSKS